jgi:hypothetical protein
MAMTIERSPSNLHPISRAFIRDGRRSSIRQLHRRNAINRTNRSIGSPGGIFYSRLDPIPPHHIPEIAAWRRTPSLAISHRRTRYPLLIMPSVDPVDQNIARTVPSTRNTIDSRGRTPALQPFALRVLA